MKLSVIIPCLNAESTLATQIEALSGQQRIEPWELIISDNGCTDNSLEIARKYEERFHAFRIIDASARKGASHARNAGVRAASADKVAFCDADDEVAPGWAALIENALSMYDVVCGKFRFDKFNEPHKAQWMTEQWKHGLYKGRFLPGGGTGNLGIKRRVHEAVGGFDEYLLHAEDADYCWRLQLEGFEIHYLPEAVVQVRMGRINPSLAYLYRRSRNRAASNYWSYKKYRHLGMLPPQPLKQSLAQWLYFLRSMPCACLLSKQERVSWLQTFVQQTGNLVGQLQGRMTNPCKPYYPGRKFGKKRSETSILGLL